jgi:hypothetical protein
MALSKAEGLRCAASFVIAAYFYVRLIPQDLRALHLDLFSLPSDSDFLRNDQIFSDNLLRSFFHRIVDPRRHGAGMPLPPVYDIINIRKQSPSDG